MIVRKISSSPQIIQPKIITLGVFQTRSFNFNSFSNSNNPNTVQNKLQKVHQTDSIKDSTQKVQKLFQNEQSSTPQKKQEDPPTKQEEHVQNADEITPSSPIFKYLNIAGKQNPKKKNLEVNAVVIDKDGNIKMIREEMRKTEFSALHSLQKRDLKTIDRPVGSQAPSLLVREKAIIINLASLRALIRDDRVYVFDNHAEDNLLSYLIFEIQGKINSKDSSKYFEMRVLEAILSTVIYSLNNIQNDLLPQIENCLHELNNSVDQTQLKTLLLLKNELTQFQSQVDALDLLFIKVLNNDEDLSNMFLTDKISNKPRSTENHIEVELLLEHYQGMIEEISSINRTTMTTIQATESLIQLSLDTQRNLLIVFDLRATLATLSISLSTFFTSIYGMNLLSGVEEDESFMLKYAVGAAGVGIVTFIAGLWRVRRVRKWDVGVHRKKF